MSDDSTTDTPDPTTNRTSRRRRRIPWLVGGGFAAAAVAVTAGYVAFAPRSGGSAAPAAVVPASAPIPDPPPGTFRVIIDNGTGAVSQRQSTICLNRVDNDFSHNCYGSFASKGNNFWAILATPAPGDWKVNVRTARARSNRSWPLHDVKAGDTYCFVYDSQAAPNLAIQARSCDFSNRGGPPVYDDLKTFGPGPAA